MNDDLVEKAFAIINNLENDKLCHIFKIQNALQNIIFYKNGILDNHGEILSIDKIKNKFNETAKTINNLGVLWIKRNLIDTKSEVFGRI